MERVGHDMHLSYCWRGPTAPLIIIMREKINMLSGLGRRKLPRREGRRGPLPAMLKRKERNTTFHDEKKERPTICHDEKKKGDHYLSWWKERRKKQPTVMKRKTGLLPAIIRRKKNTITSHDKKREEDHYLSWCSNVKPTFFKDRLLSFSH